MKGSGISLYIASLVVYLSFSGLMWQVEKKKIQNNIKRMERETGTLSRDFFNYKGYSFIMLQSKEVLVEKVLEKSIEIHQSQYLKTMILKHGCMLKTVFDSNPLFFKVIFKNSRFIVCTTALSFCLLEERAYISDLKNFFKDKKMISKNSLESFIFLLRVSRKIEVFPSETDRRQHLFKLTERGRSDSLALIKSMVLPYQNMLPDVDMTDVANAEGFLEDFFEIYGQFMLRGIYLIDLIPHSDVFIKKDSGHMVILFLLSEYFNKATKKMTISLIQVAKYCGVSRTHINGMLKNAEKQGLLSVKNLNIELHEPFFIMAYHYFSVYFSMVGLSLESAVSKFNSRKGR